MTFTMNMLVPAIALIAGVLALITPRLANFWIAIYLIVIGVVGLAPSFGFNLGITG
jgi:threonine/homoserine efflux transporter RhtA